jgi:hypothetical protein
VATSSVTDFGPDAYGTTWKPIRVGAGGFVTGMDIAPDGTKVIRTDTYGAYLWVDSQWQQLVTSSSMPSGDIAVGGTGVYEIAIAPSNTDRFYMEYNGYVYRSDNRGATWTKTSFAQVTDGSNNNYRVEGSKMAVDPANPNIAYVGTPTEGMFVTSNAGASWSQISALGTTSTGDFLVAFDRTSGVSGGKTQGIYVEKYGTGVYHSTDGGSTWTLTSGTPTSGTHMIVDQTGTVWFMPDYNPAYYDVYKYSGGAWTALPLGLGLTGYAVAVDPTNANHVIVVTSPGQLFVSQSGGSNWTEVQVGTVVATDIPWLAWSENTNPYMAATDIQFDPTNPNILYLPAGLGFWYTNLSGLGSTVSWNSQSLGIEQLSSINVLVPPGGQPIVSAWDRPDFYISNPDTFPSQYGTPNPDGNLTMGWDFDYASNNPTYVAGIMNWNSGEEDSGYSTDGGQTWTKFASIPSDVSSSTFDKIGGSIAVASSTDIVWIPSDTDQPYYTLNGGVTWTAVDPPGTSSSDAGWGWAYYIDRRIVTADRVNIGTFYAYNNGVGVFRSIDGGATWTLVYSGTLPGDGGYNAKLKAVPNKAGELFFTGGPQGTLVPATTPFDHSTDGGATWNAVPNVDEVLNFGFGKPAAGTTTPAIYIAGWVSGQYGIWESDDDANTWTQIGQWPLGTLSEVQGLSGDMNIYGRVYVALAGNGWAYGNTANVILPPVISSISSTPTTTSATITWTTDKTTTSYVEYGTTSNYGLASSSPSSVTSHDVTLTGLSPATLYHFRIASTDSNGDTSTSTDQTFDTYDPSPPSAPGNLTATATSSSEIDLSWNVSTDSYSSITEYDVFRNGSEVGTTSLTAYADKNLNSSASYSYAVKAKDALGLFSASSTASTSTLAYAGPEDINGQPYAFWSTRCGSGSYTGNVANIWDAATGNTTETLLTCSAGGVVNQTINPLSVTCSSGCNVKTLYDQSGSNSCGGSPCDVTQSTNANRPTLNTNCQDGKICVVFSHMGNTCLVSPNTTAVLNQPYSATDVEKSTDDFNYEEIWGWNLGYIADYTISGLEEFVSYSYPGGVTGTTWNELHANQMLASSTLSSWYVDGSANTGLNDGTGGVGTGAPLSIGGDANCTTDSSSWSGDWFETGIWNGDQTANNAAMNSNQHSYWGF